jgi:hypothetical protein
MLRRKAANLVKGCAWLFLAAAVMPTFSTRGETAGDVTELAVGLPWSPWLTYRESWSPADSVRAAAPVFRYETRIEPRSGSTAMACIGFVLLAASSLLRSADKKDERRRAPAVTSPVYSPTLAKAARTA